MAPIAAGFAIFLGVYQLFWRKENRVIPSIAIDWPTGASGLVLYAGLLR
ncbi:MAG: hypothetical protein CM1200mP14_02610 [Gammaproteobacteria bacterium]|nr:MAG: hypothetical protein CM1200mP14_02610 [Gammaproteobacteria bacterium]